MKTVAIPALFLLCVAPVGRSAEPLPEVRLTPKEIAGLAKASGGAGTSGLPAVTTTVLYGNPAQPGLYTIELQVAPNTTIQAHPTRTLRYEIELRMRDRVQLN